MTDRAVQLADDDLGLGAEVILGASTRASPVRMMIRSLMEIAPSRLKTAGTVRRMEKNVDAF